MRKIRDPQRRPRLIALVLLASAACGTEDPNPPGGEKSLFPVEVGNRWEFRLTNSSGVVSTKVQTVMESTAEGFTFQTVRGDRETTSVQRVDEMGRLLRLSEVGSKAGVVTERVRFDPPSLRVDLERTTLGEVYEYTFSELQLSESGDVESTLEKSQRFTVEAVDEVVAVPGGSFNCVRLKRVTVDGPEKTYWYAFGVGKVKEVGGQTEELVRADVMETE